MLKGRGGSCKSTAWGWNGGSAVWCPCDDRCIRSEFAPAPGSQQDRIPGGRLGAQGFPVDRSTLGR